MKKCEHDLCDQFAVVTLRGRQLCAKHALVETTRAKKEGERW